MTFKEVQESLERIRSDGDEARFNMENLTVSNINDRKGRVNFQTYINN